MAIAIDPGGPMWWSCWAFTMIFPGWRCCQWLPLAFGWPSRGLDIFRSFFIAAVPFEPQPRGDGNWRPRRVLAHRTTAGWAALLFILLAMRLSRDQRLALPSADLLGKRVLAWILPTAIVSEYPRGSLLKFFTARLWFVVGFFFSSATSSASPGAPVPVHSGLRLSPVHRHHLHVDLSCRFWL